MIHHVVARLRRLDEDAEGFLHLGLTEIIRKALRAQRSIEREIILHEIGRDDPLA